MNDALTCEKEISVVKRAPTGKVISRYHRRCGKPAAECVFAGMLTTAKAVLCDMHRRMAAKQATLVTVNGEKWTRL
jgi:hypothetical protein